MTWFLDGSTRTKAFLYIPASLALIQAVSSSPPSHEPLSMSNALALIITPLGKPAAFNLDYTLESLCLEWGYFGYPNFTRDQVNKTMTTSLDVGLAEIFQSSADNIQAQPCARVKNHWAGYFWWLTPSTTMGHLYSEANQIGTIAHPPSFDTVIWNDSPRQRD